MPSPQKDRDVTTAPLSPEDQKLITLARSSLGRTRATKGAAVRDLDGRTYTAASVTLPSLDIAALDLAVAMAISSGATGLEAGAVVTSKEGAIVDLSTVRELAGSDVPVYVADEGGAILAVRSS